MNKHDSISAKICSREQLAERVRSWQAEGLKVVFTNGCFDIIHKGHADYLSRAADLGDKLVVAVNTDDSVRRLQKGPSRPIQDEKARAFVMASFGFTDAVVLFDEDTPYELIRLLQPDVLVKGADYRPEDVVGYDIVTARGGKVETLSFIEGYSTSSIEKRIRENS